MATDFEATARLSTNKEHICVNCWCKFAYKLENLRQSRMEGSTNKQTNVPGFASS
jgi:hypothetical protein